MKLHEKQGKVERNRQIGTITSWGPTFRVSVDLVIKSYGNGLYYRNIISFKGNNGNDCCNNGDRVPAIFSHLTKGLHIVGSVNGKLHKFDYKGIKLRKKFNLVIEQVWINGEVCFFYMQYMYIVFTSTKIATMNFPRFFFLHFFEFPAPFQLFQSFDEVKVK